ncbi:MAG TPA: PHB depolymerase family esterase [Caulobacteraceae bacterium]|nr:PHB depolymerase family esterase [Caulobacteraceae bacterium]
MALGVGRAAATAAVLLALAGFQPGVARAADAPLLRTNQVSVGGGMHGANRPYSYYVGSKANRQGYNMVVYAFHDNGQTAEEFARTSGWIKLAEDNNFVVVFPEAANKTWSPNANMEDEYLRIMFDHSGRNFTTGETPPPQAGGGRGGAAPAAGPAPANDEGPRPAPARGVPQVRAGAWQPWNYVTGVGAGAIVAQQFAMSHPDLVAGVATLDGRVFDSNYVKGAELAEGVNENQRGEKAATPVWRPRKMDLPVPAWLFTSGSPNPAEARLEAYWKRADAVAPAAKTQNLGGFQTTVYTSPANAVSQVRATVAPAGAKYDPAMTSAIWNFFSHEARWSDSPTGTLGTMLPEADVNKMFDVRSEVVGDRTYKYYVKTPSTYRKGGQSLPLVISLHGAGFPAWMYLSQIKMHEVGEKEGFITAYLNGQQNRWDFTQPEGPDAKAIEQLINEMATNYGVDRSRVYLQGFSFGSGMTYAEGITHPKLFAAVSPNSGIGDMTPAVLAWPAADLKTKGDTRIPMMVVYGGVDGGGSTDGLIPAVGVIRTAVDYMKAYNKITTPDRIERFNSPNSAPYDLLVPGARTSVSGVDAHYKGGRFKHYDYFSADAKPLPLFSLVWVTDMPHGTDPRQAQMIWDYFKQWRRNADGTVTYTAAPAAAATKAVAAKTTATKTTVTKTVAAK